MTWRRTLDLYFLRKYLSSVLATTLAVFVLVFVIDLIEVSRRGQFADLGFEQAAMFTLLRVPAFMEQAFPFIVLFSSISTLLQLNRRLELVVARAAGVSIWQILAPFVAGSLLFGIVVTLAFNPVAAYGKSAAETLIAAAGSDDPPGDDSRGIPWLRQSAEGVTSVIGADMATNNGTRLHTVSAFILQDGVSVARIDAPKAELNGGFWTLYEPRVTRAGNRPEFPRVYRLPTSLRAEYVEQRLADPEAISIWSLPGKIAAASSLGVNAMAFSMQYNWLISQPALFVAMTLVGATVATRFSRLGQSGRTIAGGVLAGFVLYVVAFLAKALGSNDIVPPVVAAWFPVLSAGLFGVTALLHQEDG